MKLVRNTFTVVGVAVTAWGLGVWAVTSWRRADAARGRDLTPQDVAGRR